MRLRNRLPDQIETARLTLRPPRLSDLGDLVAEANNWKVLEPTASLPFPYLEEHGRAFLQKQQRAVHHPYVMADRVYDRLLGIIGFYVHDQQPMELGYWLGEHHWGNGYASEAVGGLLRAASDSGIFSMRARVLSTNVGSIWVLKKTGFAIVEETVSMVERHKGKPLLVLEWRR